MSLSPSRTSSLVITALLASLALGQPCAQASVKEWRRSTVAGAKAYKELCYGEAEREFKKAIEEARKFGSDDLRLAASLANLGVLYNYRGFFDKAEPLFEESVRIKEKKLGPANNDVISSSGKLAQFYLKRGNFDKAAPLAERVIQYGDRRVIELGKFKKEHKDPKEVHKVLNQYLELAVLFDKMAASYQGHAVNGRYPESEKLYKLSLKLREQALTGDHLALSHSWENLGRLYLKEGRYALAEPLLKKSYKASKSTLGFTNPRTYAKLDAWSQSLSGLGRGAQAEGNYRLALTSFKEAYGANSGYIASIETALAHALSNRGQYSTASVHLKRALKIEEKLRGPNHAIVAALRNDYLSTLKKARRFDEAARFKASSEAESEL